MLFDVQTSYKPSNIVVNVKFPRATYHTIVPLKEELYSLIIPPSNSSFTEERVEKKNL